MSKSDIEDCIAFSDLEGGLRDGDDLSEEACDLLFFSDTPISSKVKKALVANLSPSSSGGLLPPLTAELHCPCCGKQHPTIRISKSAISQRKLSPFTFLDNESRNYEFSDECTKTVIPGLLCQDCFNKARNALENFIPLYFNMPIEKLKETLQRQELLTSDSSFALPSRLFTWGYGVIDGEKRIVYIKGQYRDYSLEWDDEEYKKYLVEQEALRAKKMAERALARQERIEKAFEEYVAKLDEVGLPSNQLPSAPESEFQIIKYLLFDLCDRREICEVLASEMFTGEPLRKIYSVIKDCYDNGIITYIMPSSSVYKLIIQMIEERYGHEEMLNVIQPFEQLEYSERHPKSPKNVDAYIYNVVVTYIERELYIVSRRVQHTVHNGSVLPFLLLQYVSGKLKVLNSISEAASKLHAEFPEYPQSRMLSFGKYKGRQVMEIMEKDPCYIEWILKNTTFMLTEEEAEYYKIFRQNE